MCFPQILQSIANSLAPFMPLIDTLGIVATLSALIWAILAFKGSKIQLRQQVYHDLMSEYRTPEMLRALELIGGIASGNDGKDGIKIAAEYRDKSADDANIKPSYRLVMQYYYEIALVTKDKFIRRLFYLVWNKKSLSIIPNLILPHERHKEDVIYPTKAPDFKEPVPQERDWKVLRYLERLYNEAPDDPDLR